MRRGLPHVARAIAILPGVRRRLMLSAGVVAVIVIAIVVASSGGSSKAPAAGTPTSAALIPRASDDLTSARNRAQVVDPVAGESAADAALPTEDASDQAPRPTSAASSTSDAKLKTDAGPTDDTAISAAEVLKNGIALPPIEAPSAVRSIIEAGNYIARTPYLWGGGHGKWIDRGYDCSGSISYALARAGLLSAPLDSGRLMGWGEPGKGKWVTIYANSGHVYMVVAGVRFDTSGTKANGSRWQSAMRPGGGFVARHPAGL
jgi:cell wall-associated NlpC family hydrolase